MFYICVILFLIVIIQSIKIHNLQKCNHNWVLYGERQDKRFVIRYLDYVCSKCQKSKVENFS